MKVLKKGRSQKGWAKEYTCEAEGGCGARLLVEKRDIHSWGKHDYGGGYDIYYSFCCPICHVRNFIPDPHFPD